MDWVKGRCGFIGIVWTGQSKSMDWVEREYGLGKGRVWMGIARL